MLDTSIIKPWFMTSTMVYGMYNDIVIGVYQPTNITRGPHFAESDGWIQINHDQGGRTIAPATAKPGRK